MKLIAPIIISSLIFLSACTTSELRNTVSTNPITTSGEVSIMKPYNIGSVDTAFKLIGPDHKIEVGAIPDPKVAGITCFYSRAKTGGISGGLGLATDTSDASVACRQTGKISFREAIKPTEEIWNESTSILFKKIRIVRFYDQNSNSLIYLVYSDKLIDGSPKNSISAVALESITPLIH
jgi:CreA protein